ncbi:MAG: hypothetical protein ABIQ18_08390 [Umezawaea sp.]
MHAESRLWFAADQGYWYDQAVNTLACYLVAGALVETNLARVAEWVADPDDPAPLQALHAHPDTVPKKNLDLLIGMLAQGERHRTGVFVVVDQAVNARQGQDRRARDLLDLAAHGEAIPHIEAAVYELAHRLDLAAPIMYADQAHRADVTSTGERMLEIVAGARRLAEAAPAVELAAAGIARARGVTVRQLAEAAGISERAANDRYRVRP